MEKNRLKPGLELMRILFANPIAGLGGAELFLLEILQELRARAPDWDLHLLSGADGPLLNCADEMGVECHVLPFPRRIAELGDSSAGMQRGIMGLLRSAWSTADYVRRFRRFVNRLQPEILHSNGLKFHVLTGLARPRRVRLAWLMHDYLGQRRLLRHVVPRLAGPVDLIWANSESVAADTRRLISTRPLKVLHCGIDLDRFSPGASCGEWLDLQCGASSDGFRGLRIGLVATYARWKGQDVFLEAAAQLMRRVPDRDVRFYIIGGPIYQTTGSQFSEFELRDLAQRLGLDARVQFCPFQSDIVPVYRALDVVVHASRNPEPFGRTILEAMACGRAVIASHAGGAAEIFTAGHDALGTPPGDIPALTEALQQLVCDSALRQNLSTHARQTALKFSRARMGERLFQTYRDLGLPAVRRAACATTAVPAALPLKSELSN